MTKDELITGLAEKSALSSANAAKALNALTSIVISELSAGRSVTLQGVGAFDVIATSERDGRNPSTGKAMTIPASRKVKFKAASSLKRMVVAATPA